MKPWFKRVSAILQAQIVFPAPGAALIRKCRSSPTAGTAAGRPLEPPWVLATGEGPGSSGIASPVLASGIEAADQRIIDAVAPTLRADGLTFVGLDVVDGHLTEVNVTSPTGIRPLADLTGTRPDIDVIRWLERRVR